MKKLFLSTLLIGATAGAYAQGFIALDNGNNTNSSPAAASGGLFFLNGAAVTADFNAAFYGGTDSANLSLIATFLLSNHTADGDVTGLNQAGRFYDPTGGSYPIANSTTTAFIQVQAWTGQFSSYAAAVAAGAPAAQSSVFANGVAIPPSTAPELDSMPGVNMTAGVVPEPSTFALAGLGAAAMLIFRRRK